MTFTDSSFPFRVIGFLILGLLLPAGIAGAEDQAAGSADVVVWRDAAGTFHAETRDEIIFSGGNILDAIQYAMDSLTPGRTVKETVRVVSSGTVTRSVDTGRGGAVGLMIPSYTILDIPATIVVNTQGTPPDGGSFDVPVLIGARDAEHIDIPNINIRGSIDWGIKLESVSNVRIGRGQLNVSGGSPVRIDDEGTAGRSHDIQVNSLYVEGGNGHALEARGVERLQVGRVLANHMRGSAVRLVRTKDVTIGRVIGYNPASTGGDATLQVSGTEEGRIVAGEVVSIHSPRGIRIHGGAGEIVLSNVYIDGARNRGVVIEGASNVILRGGVIKNVVGRGIDVFPVSDDGPGGRAAGVTIANMRIFDDRPAGQRTQTHGIAFFGRNGMIVDNDLRNAGTEASMVVGSPSTLVRDNIGGGVAAGRVTLSASGRSQGARVEGVSDFRGAALQLRARTVSGPSSSFAWSHYFEYNGATGRWDLIFEWRNSPGESVEVEYIVDQTPANLGLDDDDFVLPPPEPPTGLRAASDFDRVILEWQLGTGIYHEVMVTRSATPGGPYETIASLDPAAVSYVDTSVAEGETWYYAVAARGMGAESESTAVGIVVYPSLWTWIPFDEGSGAVARDATDGERDAALAGGAGWGQGRNGSALLLPGTSGSYAGLPPGIGRDLSAITISAWVYWEGGDNWQRIFDFGHDTSRYAFLTPRSGPGTLRFAITTSGNSGEEIIQSASALSIGSWNHVAVTISGNTGRLFLNGDQVGSNSSMTLRPSDLGVTPNNWIGRSQWPDPYFNGRVQDFRIYAGALSQSEIATLVEHGATLPVPPVLYQAELQEGGEAVLLSWQKIADAEHYTVWRSVGEDGFDAIAENVEQTHFSDENPVPGKWHTYRVTAFNAAGESPPSAEMGVDVPDGPPSGDLYLKSVRIEGQNIVLSMPAVSGFLYQLQHTADLDSGDWEDVGDPVPASGGEVELSEARDTERDRGFYRVVIRPDS